MADQDFLGPRGRHIWNALSWDGIAPPESTYLVELCRMADRLELIDEAIRAGSRDLFTEGRLQQTAFRQIVGEWRRMTMGGGSHTVDSREDEGPADDDFLDELAARRAARFADAAGGEVSGI